MIKITIEIDDREPKTIYVDGQNLINKNEFKTGQKKCVKCGELFTPASNRQIYCSVKCGLKKK